MDLAFDCKDTQADLWNRISRDEYMAYAVKECYYSVERILLYLLDDEGRLWWACVVIQVSFLNINYFLHSKRLVTFEVHYFRVERLFREINGSIAEGSLVVTVNLKKLQALLSRLIGLTGLLVSHQFYCTFHIQAT